MKTYKQLLVASAIVTLALLGASPSAASARVWKDKGTNVAKFFEIGLTGGEVVEAAGGGLSCEIHATLNSSGGSTGNIVKYENKKCTGFGALAKCTLATFEARDLPWTLTLPAGPDMTVAGWHLRRTFKTGCPITELDKTISPTFTFDSTAAISSMEFKGSIAGYEAFGSFTVDSPDAGTYGIG